MKMILIEVETAIKMKVSGILEQLNQSNSQTDCVIIFVEICIVEAQEQDISTQFLQLQKNQSFDSQQHFERYCKVLPVFGFNSAKYDTDLSNFFLLPILSSEQDIEPTVKRRLITLFPSNFAMFSYLTS